MRNNIKKILVTGGLGYVGCALVKRLLQIGHKVNILDLGIWASLEKEIGSKRSTDLLKFVNT